MAPARIEDALYRAATMCLSPDWQIRVSWPDLDMPGWKREEDVCFLRVTPFGDGYTRLSETGDDGARAIIRGHEAQFVLYGPNAYEGAEAIRKGILSVDVRRFLWAECALAPLAHIAPPQRLDEWFSGAWWRRYDAVVRFYEGVTDVKADAPPIIHGPDVRLIGG